MSLEDYKLLAFTDNVQELPNRPGIGATALKAWFDAAPDELRVKYNALIDALMTPQSIPGESIANQSLDATKFVPGVLTNETANGLQIVEINEQLADIVQYVVSKTIPNRHLTINSAYNQWIADGKPFAVINIKQGTYDEYLNIGGLVNNNTLIFRGENKYTTIWQYGNGEYAYACFTGGGNIQFENLTVHAHHGDNLAFIEDGHSAAYALHLDHPDARGKMVVKNCILQSEQDSALGCGTSLNQHLIIEDTELYSTAPEGLAGNHGALLYHTSALANQTGQRFTLKNCYASSLHGPGYTVLSTENSANVQVPVEFINNIAHSNFYESLPIGSPNYEQRVVFYNANGLIQVSQDSKLNNSERLNYNNGKCVIYADMNDAVTGLIGASGATLNTPYVGSFSGHAIKYNDDFITQKIYDVLTYRKFRRDKKNGTWEETWYEFGSTKDDCTPFEYADLNLATKPQFWRASSGAINTPIAGHDFAGITYVFASNFVRHECYDLGTDIKYWRKLFNGTWGSWTAM